MFRKAGMFVLATAYTAAYIPLVLAVTAIDAVVDLLEQRQLVLIQRYTQSEL
jgi:hypothetical protein